MPHLHLSLQHGDDMILKRMKRRHSRADAIRFADEVRRLRPDVVFGADLIAGFPTETEAMFGNSLSHRRGLRPDPPPRLSVLAAARHAGRAHAAARPRRWSRSAPPRLRARRRGGARRPSRRASTAPSAGCWSRATGLGRTEHFTPAPDRRGRPRATIVAGADHRPHRRAASSPPCSAEAA